MADQDRRSERQRRRAEPLPAALPPETRTVGQLVAESIRLYGRSFWRSLALGIPLAVAGVVVAELPAFTRLPLALTAGAVAASVSYALASAFTAGVRPEPRRIVRATEIGVVTLVPAILILAYLGLVGLLPAVAWLAFVGLAVPVAVIESRLSLRRALELARADLAHAIGSLATLALVGLLSAYVLFFTLRSAGTAALRASAFLSVLVISPLLFLGASLLYFDQSARVPGVGSRPRRRRRDADLHPAVQPDRAGRPDTQVESGPAAGGQQ
ncbi:MAG TPA: hypothetical protein VF002_07485 [Gaiellaceae bacterium]